MGDHQDDEAAIRAYVAERADQDVVHVEHAASEMVGPVRHEVWDVGCTNSRWWVVTNPTSDACVALTCGTTRSRIETTPQAEARSRRQELLSYCGRIVLRSLDTKPQALCAADRVQANLVQLIGRVVAGNVLAALWPERIDRHAPIRVPKRLRVEAKHVAPIAVHVVVTFRHFSSRGRAGNWRMGRSHPRREESKRRSTARGRIPCR
jgi:hypothetical protein